MMITVGLISFTASIITWFFLPDSPTRARFLTEDEKKKFVERVRRNDQGIKNIVFKRSQAIEAIRDPFSWMLFLLAVNQTLVVGGINTFNALLINKAFKFSVTDSQLLSIPLGAMVIITYQLMACVPCTVWYRAGTDSQLRRWQDQADSALYDRLRLSESNRYNRPHLRRSGTWQPRRPDLCILHDAMLPSGRSLAFP